MRTRFAPSPTGRLHIGGARTALFAYLWAKKEKGEFMLRIDDTDRERSRKEYEDDIKNALKWLEIEWDLESRQSERLERYKEVAYKLLEEGYAYRCLCTPEELEEKRKLALKQGKKPMYDGTCRERKDFPNRPFAIRFKVPQDLKISFQDLILGRISFDASEIEDFIILRSDGNPTYNLSSVVDDIDFKITHIIRGDDHVSNTPKQILVFNALKATHPEFAHLPTILGPDRTRLSKRHGAISILELRNSGYVAEAVVNHLARLGWSYGDQEVFSMDELVEKFSLKDVGRSPASYNPEKLLWLNSEWMKKLPDKVIAERIKPFLKDPSSPTSPGFLRLVSLSKIRTKTLVEITDMLSFWFGIREYQENGLKFLDERGKSALRKVYKALKSKPSREEFEKFLRKTAEEEGVKTVFVAQALRMALTGKLVSPPLYDTILALGFEESMKRIKYLEI